MTGAENAPARNEAAPTRTLADGDVLKSMMVPATRTSHVAHSLLMWLKRVLPGATILLTALIAFSLPALSTEQGRVLPGVDVLLSGQSDLLTGKRVGLITHRAAAGVSGSPTAQLLTLDPRARVVGLFAPEHGLSGSLPAGSRVPSSEGSIPVYSLYGDTLRPTHQMLADIDVLVFDLQDVGARAYTYISTMALAMQAAAEYSKVFAVLDRPNPLGGQRVDGPVLNPAFASFIGIYAVPAVHGMTMGELAMMFNREFGIGAHLIVVTMAGWDGSMQWEDTGLVWLPPSPMIPSPAAAVLHAATGMLEGTNLSVGSGTSVPFETVTRLGLRGDLLAQRLNRAKLPGVRFDPIVVGSGDQKKGGIRLIVTDARRFLPDTTAVHILASVRDLHPGLLQFLQSEAGGRYRFDLLWGTDTVRLALLQGRSADSIVASWQSDLRRFLEVRQRYLLYPRMPGVSRTLPRIVEAPIATIKSPAKAAPPRVSPAPAARLPVQTDHTNPEDQGVLTSVVAIGLHNCARPVICGALAGASVK